MPKVADEMAWPNHHSLGRIQELKEIDKVVQAFVALGPAIDLIQSLEWGQNNSQEGLSQGYSHCFRLTFADASARDEYLPHPAHQAFVAFSGPFIDKVLVFDYLA